MATKLGSVVGYRSGIYNGYKVIGTQTLGLRGLVLWLKFNEGSGNIAYDSSFYNNQGTIYGATWTDGKFGKALSFDGVDDYVEVPLTNSLKPQSLTITAWIYPEDFSTNSAILRTAGTNYGYFLYVGKTTKKLLFMLGNGTDSQWMSGNTALSENQWYFVTVTYDTLTDTVKIYINGQLDAEYTYSYDTIAYTGTYLTIGSVWKQYQFWKGVIDEVRIFNRALSENEIKMLYYNKIGAVPSKAI